MTGSASIKPDASHAYIDLDKLTDELDTIRNRYRFTIHESNLMHTMGSATESFGQMLLIHSWQNHQQPRKENSGS